MSAEKGAAVRPDAHTKGVGAIAYAALMGMLAFIAWQTVENRGDIQALKATVQHVLYRLDRIEARSDGR
jgi:hypothetical protein